MSMRRIPIPATVAALTLALAPLTAVAAQAQERGADQRAERAAPPRVFLGGSLVLGDPVGELDRYLGEMPGGSVNGVARLDRRGLLGVRVEAGLLQYGSEHRRVMLSPTIGGRVLGDLRTTNMIVYAGAGPQLVVPGGTVRPYIDGSIGVAYFATTSSIGGDNGGTFASDTNYDDATFAWGAGAGVYIPLGRGRTPFWLDLGARYHGNGRATYLREGDIEDLPDGSITFEPIDSGANLVTFHLGLIAGLHR